MVKIKIKCKDFIIIQGDKVVGDLDWVDFDLDVPLPAQFCLGR